MTSPTRLLRRAALALLLFWPVLPVFAQGYDVPLTIQGLHHTPVASVASRGAGGASLIVAGDLGRMFSNPAALAEIKAPQVSTAAFRRSVFYKQDQRYGGLQGHSAFGPLMEGTTGTLSDPDTSKPGITARSNWNQADSVQRPFDSIGPNWGRTKSGMAPIQLMAAIPLSVSDIDVVIAAGVVEYADLNRYYQNNNCLSPSVLSVLEGTIRTTTLPVSDATATPAVQPYLVQWYQYSQQRDGSIYGYGGSVAASFLKDFSVGASVMILSGSTDDREIRTGRGRLVFFNSSLRVDRMGVTNFEKVGTSDFSGMELTGSVQYAGRNVSAALSVTLPTTITRTFSSTVTQDSVTGIYVSNVLPGALKSDSSRVSSSRSVSGEDKLELPLRGAFSLALNIRSDLKVALEYEVRATEAAVYTDASGAADNPWNATSIFRLGAQYQAADWLTIRCGVTNYQEVFEPLSHALRGDAIEYPVYSLGAGVSYMGIRVDLAYEYSDMKFVDTWSNAASINRAVGNAVAASVTYDIPW